MAKSLCAIMAKSNVILLVGDQTYWAQAVKMEGKSSLYGFYESKSHSCNLDSYLLLQLYTSNTFDYLNLQVGNTLCLFQGFGHS